MRDADVKGRCTVLLTIAQTSQRGQATQIVSDNEKHQWVVLVALVTSRVDGLAIITHTNTNIVSYCTLLSAITSFGFLLLRTYFHTSHCIICSTPPFFSRHVGSLYTYTRCTCCFTSR